MTSKPEAKLLGTLVVVALKARNLRNPQPLNVGKVDPFATFRVGSVARRIKTDKRGGQFPEWDDDVRFEIRDTNEYKRMKVQVYAEDKREDDLIGEKFLELKEVLEKGEWDSWFPIEYRNKYAGDIFLEMTFYKAGEAPPAPPGKQLGATPHRNQPTAPYPPSKPTSAPPQGYPPSGPTPPPKSPSAPPQGVYPPPSTGYPPVASPPPIVSSPPLQPIGASARPFLSPQSQPRPLSGNAPYPPPSGYPPPTGGYPPVSSPPMPPRSPISSGGAPFAFPEPVPTPHGAGYSQPPNGMGYPPVNNSAYPPVNNSGYPTVNNSAYPPHGGPYPASNYPPSAYPPPSGYPAAYPPSQPYPPPNSGPGYPPGQYPPPRH